MTEAALSKSDRVIATVRKAEEQIGKIVERCTSQVKICSEIEQSIAKEFVYQLYRICYLQVGECDHKNLIGSEHGVTFVYLNQ